MTRTHSTITHECDSSEAGKAIARDARAAMDGATPDAVIVFVSPQHDYRQLLTALRDESGCEVIAGASSAGEFTNVSNGGGLASALVLQSDTMKFAVGIGRNVSQDPQGAAQSVVSSFKGLAGRYLPHRGALVMTDALAGHAELMIEELTVATAGNYSFFGGGAGDDARFAKTHVFAGTEAMTDAVVALEMQSLKPIGVGVSHGWLPTELGYRVTAADGARLISLNGAPAIHAFETHAAATNQLFDRADPLPFFLHNILGIKSNSDYRLRVPLGVNEDGSISCAAAVPLGAIVHIMKTTVQSAVLAAEQATRAALDAIGDRRPQAALVFDCVATRMRLGSSFDDELKACADLLQPAGFVGCNTYGQIARAEGQFGGFHNCTAVVCVLPE